MNMCPSNDLAIFTTRISKAQACPPASLRQMAPKNTDCVELLGADVRFREAMIDIKQANGGQGARYPRNEVFAIRTLQGWTDEYSSVFEHQEGH